MPNLADTSMPLEDHVEVVCLYCQRSQQVGRRALSIPRHYCHRTLRLEDMVFTGYEARRMIETCGTIIIEQAGNVVAQQVLCGGLVVRGRLRGAVRCQGMVRMSASAQLRGDVTAPGVQIEAGATLVGDYVVGTAASQIHPPQQLHA